jgi:hypothetical protein
MSRRWKIGMVFATVFTLVNLGGIPIAAVAGELRHTVLHVVLAVAGAIMLWALAARRSHAREYHVAGIDAPVDRIEALQQSVDAIALEVERIGEAQRFSARLQQEQPERPARPI